MNHTSNEHHSYDPKIPVSSLLARPSRIASCSGWIGVGGLLAVILVKFLLYIAASYLANGPEVSLCQWDCRWDVHTIQNGYDTTPPWPAITQDEANWAFFPLYPLLSRTVKKAIGLSAFWSGTAVSVLCFMAFAYPLPRYRALTRPGTNQVSWILLLLVYPFSLYFFMVYTESLYLLLTVLLLISVRLRAYDAAGLVTGILTAARPTGVIAIPYLAAGQAWRARQVFSIRPNCIGAGAYLG